MRHRDQTLIAASLVAFAPFAHALVPRYEVRELPGGPTDRITFSRLDRWHGTMEVGFGRADVMPTWLTINTASRRVEKR